MRRSNLLRIIFFMLAFVFSAPCIADSNAVPSCRFDSELALPVQKALSWGMEHIKGQKDALRFNSVVVNPEKQVSKTALRVLIVKDATERTVDSAGCIRREEIDIPSGIVFTDGSCLASSAEKCTGDERKYMQQRFAEIHNIAASDNQSGYESSGACYMTNQQACLRIDRLDMLKQIGKRDALTVKGTCLANPGNPAEIRCSAGALKMLMSIDARKDDAPTLGLLLVLAHELGHLIANQSSTYGGGDNVVDMSWSVEDKLAKIRNQCAAGDASRQREAAADDFALEVARDWVPRMRRYSPHQGSPDWLITQAIHQSTNLARFNSDWIDASEAITPAVFEFNPSGQVIRLDEADISNIRTGANASGRTPQQTMDAARGFLCDLTTTTTDDSWDLLMQSGTTHGTMVERLGAIMAILRPAAAATKKDPVAELEFEIGRLQDLVLTRHRTYLRELEGSICAQLDQQLVCGTESAPSLSGSDQVLLPIKYQPVSGYREVSGDAAALTITLGTGIIEDSLKKAAKESEKVVQKYASILSQIDQQLLSEGGYWISRWHPSVVVGWNGWGRAYIAGVRLHAVVRVPANFSLKKVPALTTVWKMNHKEGVKLVPWNDARSVVGVKFTESSLEHYAPDHFVYAENLPFDKIFDLEKARAGDWNHPASFFQDLLSYMHETVQKNTGKALVLEPDNFGKSSPIWIDSMTTEDDHHMPKSWMSMNMQLQRTHSDSELSSFLRNLP